MTGFFEDHIRRDRQGISEMRSSHAAAAVSSPFDAPNLIAYGGLEPVVRPAERCGLPKLAGEHVRLPASKEGTGAFPAAILMSLVGGMAAGAHSIDDMDRLRHGAMGRLISGARAPSTLGSFLRSFTHGHVKQLHAVARRFLHELARHTALLPGADQATYVDIDDTIHRTHGHAKQGVGYGYSKVKGLNALLGVVSTLLSAPVIAATRLCKGPLRLRARGGRVPLRQPLAAKRVMNGAPGDSSPLQDLSDFRQARAPGQQVQPVQCRIQLLVSTGQLRLTKLSSPSHPGLRPKPSESVQDHATAYDHGGSHPKTSHSNRAPSKGSCRRETSTP
ncbi:hypothetical protein ACWDR3_30610 [Streptomyces sp. NPDC001002]